MFQSPAFKVFDFLFGIPLIHDIMFGVYRKQIVEKAGENILYSLLLSLHSLLHTGIFFCLMRWLVLVLALLLGEGD
jgi:hypothetical protein